MRYDNLQSQKIVKPTNDTIKNEGIIMCDSGSDLNNI